MTTKQDSHSQATVIRTRPPRERIAAWAILGWFVVVLIADGAGTYLVTAQSNVPAAQMDEVLRLKEQLLVVQAKVREMERNWLSPDGQKILREQLRLAQIKAGIDPGAPVVSEVEQELRRNLRDRETEIAGLKAQLEFAQKQITSLKPTPPPVIPTPRPVDPTPRPVDPTPRPADPTPRPADPTPRPAVPTPRPADPTPKPVDPTPKPAVPTPQPAVPTPRPADPTPKPVDPTSLRLTPNPVPDLLKEAKAGAEHELAQVSGGTGAPQIEIQWPALPDKNLLRTVFKDGCLRILAAKPGDFGSMDLALAAEVALREGKLTWTWKEDLAKLAEAGREPLKMLPYSSLLLSSGKESVRYELALPPKRFEMSLATGFLKLEFPGLPPRSDLALSIAGEAPSKPTSTLKVPLGEKTGYSISLDKDGNLTSSWKDLATFNADRLKEAENARASADKAASEMYHSSRMDIAEYKQWEARVAKAKKDQARIEAEIARLKEVQKNWEPAPLTVHVRLRSNDVLIGVIEVKK